MRPSCTGRVRGRGTRATREVYVHVRGLDRDGSVVFRERSVPATQVIAPSATGRFSVTIADRDDVDRYHVEAFAR